MLLNLKHQMFRPFGLPPLLVKILILQLLFWKQTEKIVNLITELIPSAEKIGNQ